MREIRTYGSEGGAMQLNAAVPTPITLRCSAGGLTGERFNAKPRRRNGYYSFPFRLPASPRPGVSAFPDQANREIGVPHFAVTA